MERDSSSIFPLQRDDQDLINNYQDFSIWDSGYDQFLYSADNNLPKVEGEINFGRNEPNNLQKVDEEMEKKLQHREIERQRRKEMADLYASLRSVLPSKSIKGMRSVSDQIHEATRYIKYMQNKVRQMKMKRDNMKKSQENEKLGFMRDQGSSSSQILPTTVRVQPRNGGIEVLIGYDYTVEGRNFRLSRILQLLFEEGLNVVECNCTKYNGRLNYIINSEVLGSSNIELQMLQEKLDLAINQHNI